MEYLDYIETEELSITKRKGIKITMPDEMMNDVPNGWVTCKHISHGQVLLRQSGIDSFDFSNEKIRLSNVNEIINYLIYYSIKVSHRKKLLTGNGEKNKHFGEFLVLKRYFKSNKVLKKAFIFSTKTDKGYFLYTFS